MTDHDVQNQLRQHALLSSLGNETIAKTTLFWIAANKMKELEVENRILHRSYNELYEKVYGPNVKPIYAHV